MSSNGCVLANIPFGDECFLSLELGDGEILIMRIDDDLPGGCEVIEKFKASRVGLSLSLKRLNELFLATAQ